MIPKRLEFLVSPDLPPAQLAGIFASAGHQLYLVGGSVRDAFLDRPVEDYDFATDARPERIRRLVHGWADSVHDVGATFGTIAARKNGHNVEITTFRDEVYRSDSRKPQVRFSDNIEADLARRDFTINAIAFSMTEHQPVDPFDGLTDLGRGLLRTPLAPEVSFSDDPLRMLRLFRFQATLGFTSAEEALEAVRIMADRINIISAERVRDELSHLLLAPSPEEALLGLVESGLTDHFLPELSALAMEQDPEHRHKDVLAHTIAVVGKTSPDLTLRLAALLHDIGKPATRDYGPDGVTFHHHEVVGARMARDRLQALKYSKEIVGDVAELVFLHLRPHTFKMGWSDSAVRRYVRDAGHLLERLNELVRCDVTTASDQRAAAIQAGINELERRIEVLAGQEELARLRPPIDGHAVMAYLGIEPGPMVGEIMGILLEKRIEEGPYSPRGAYQTVRDWATAKGLPDPGPSPDLEEE